MSLVVEEVYPNGVPQTAVANFAPPGAGWHWSAGGTGRSGWNGTVAHLINTRSTINASYHGGFWPEHAANHVGCKTIIQWIVRTTRAAHSVNPGNSWKYNANKSKSVQDARFAEVRRILGAKSSDPNSAMIALAYAGMPADLQRDLQCPVFRADVQELARQIAAHPTVIDRPHFGHGWIQPLTRYEMDVATDFIGLLYGKESTGLPAQGMDLMYIYRVQEEWWAEKGTKFTVMLGGVPEEKVFSSRTRVRSIAEGGGMRLVDAHWDGTKFIKFTDGELLHVDRDAQRTLFTPITGSRKPAPGSYGPPPPETVIKEVVKEVPTGITQEMVRAAETKAAQAEQDRIAAAEAARIKAI